MRDHGKMGRNGAKRGHDDSAGSGSVRVCASVRMCCCVCARARARACVGGCCFSHTCYLSGTANMMVPEAG